MIPIFVGYDSREAACFAVFNQSAIDSTSVPFYVSPLHGPLLNGFDGQKDGTNRFIYSRYLVPSLMNYEGWALYVDSDILCRDDLKKLWDLRDERMAVQVVKHSYKTTEPKKFVNTPIEAENQDYPRKNWSSVILWNCGHIAHKGLTPDFVASKPGSYLHRFKWVPDDEIGDIPQLWNHLVGEYPRNESAALAHYTLGAPGFSEYALSEFHQEWHNTLLKAVNMVGEDPPRMVKRAKGLA